MSGSEWDNQNPYASPRTDVGTSGDTIAISPRGLPHDVLDILLGVC
jgi:hypothetical protein